MTTENTGTSEQRFREVDGVIVFETPLEKIEREQAAAKQRDTTYNDEQLKINRQQLTVNRRLMIFTGLLLFTSAVSGGIAIYQAHVANISAKAAGDAAYSACLASQIARNTLLEIQSGENDSHNLALGSVTQAIAVSRGEAAQLRFNLANHFEATAETTSGKGKVIGEIFWISNVGRTSAFNIKGETQIEILVRGREPDFRYPTPNRFDTGQLDVGAPPEKMTFLVKASRGKSKFFTEEEIGKIFKVTDLVTFIYGRLTYSDIFGVRHWVQTCMIMTPKEFTVNLPRHPKCAEYNKSDINQVMPLPAAGSVVATSNLPQEIPCKKPGE